MTFLALAAAFFLQTAPASARELGHIISVKDPLEQCLPEVTEAVAKNGGQVLRVLNIVGVVTTAKLTPAAVANLQRERCILSVEAEQILYPSPRTGRMN